MFDETVRYHFSCGLTTRSQNARFGKKKGATVELTDKNMSETVEPVSACSPTNFNRREGSFDKIRTTGCPVFSCRSRESEEVRK